MASVRPTRAEIRLDTVRENARRLSEAAGVSIWAVIKADGYGHGAAQVGRALAAEPCVRGLAVSLVEEAVELRDRGIEAPILVMGPSLLGGYQEITGRDLTAVISQLSDLDGLLRAGEKNAGKRTSIQLKIDSGMNRLGLHASDLEAALTRPGLELAGLMTHLASADEDDPDDPDSQTKKQLIRFATSSARVRRRASGQLETHAAASSALLKFPGSRLDVARPGIGLFGNGLAAQLDGVDGAMRFVTEVAQVRSVGSGESVSYGAEWTAPRDSTIAVLPLGYADGFPRAMGGAEGSASVLCQGRRFPVVGRVCMDLVMIDVTDSTNSDAKHPAVGVGDEVTLLGEQGAERITAAEFARFAKVSEYEVTCGISKRVPRVYRLSPSSLAGQ